MEMDYSLLDIGPGDEPSEAVEASVADPSFAATEAVVESEPAGTSSGKQAPQQPVAETPVDDFDDSTPLTPREKILMERLDRITGENLAKTTTEKAREAPVVTTPEVRNFLENLDINDVLATSENLNSVLSAVYNEALTTASKLSAEQILQNLPNIISTYVTQHITMNRLVDDFYSRNPDLQSVKQTVASVANKIAAEHPEYTTEQVFDASAVETRNILRIKNITPTTNTSSKQQKPAFAPSTNGRARERAPVLTGIEKDVLDLIT